MTKRLLRISSDATALRCAAACRHPLLNKADAENAFLEEHGWRDYGAWHLGLTEGANDETKARYAFVVGDFSRVHRVGLIACVYRASEWRHKEIELAAHDLLQYLDRASWMKSS